MQTEKRKSKGLTMRKVELMVGLIPIITCALVIVIFANIELRNIMYADVEERLRAVAIATRMNLETHGGLDEAQLYLNTINEDGTEITIINGATRAITTLKNDKGEYITGTDIDSEILAVLKSGEDYSSEDVVISGKDYIVYYTPIFIEGEYVGAVFTGMDKASTDAHVIDVSNAFVLVSFIACVIFAAAIIFVVQIICKRLDHICGNLECMAEGRLKDVDPTKQRIWELNIMQTAMMSLNNKLKDVVGDVSNAAAKLDEITDAVAENCSVATQATSDIGKASEEIAHGTTNLAENTQNMNAELIDMGEHIDSTTEKVSGAYDNTVTATSIASDLVENLEKLIAANGSTKEHTDDVVRSIQETSEAIDAIGSAATFIESIAGQTNLLSLNASIEAARAGDAGRGFAVVASEIKNLAEQSAKSANDVQTIIKTIIEKSEQNTKSAQAISEAVDSEMELLQIVHKGVNEVSDSVTMIGNEMADVKSNAVAMNDEKTSILDGIQSLSSISQENAAITEETNATVEELHANMELIDEQSKEVASQAKTLLETIKFFQV